MGLAWGSDCGEELIQSLTVLQGDRQEHLTVKGGGGGWARRNRDEQVFFPEALPGLRLYKLSSYVGQPWRLLAWSPADCLSF